MAPKSGDAIMMLTLAPGATVESCHAIFKIYPNYVGRFSIKETDQWTCQQLLMVCGAKSRERKLLLQVLPLLFQFEGILH